MKVSVKFSIKILINGMAYHYQRYSGNCESAKNLVWAEEIAKDEKLGVWNGSHEKPWEWRKRNK